MVSSSSQLYSHLLKRCSLELVTIRLKPRNCSSTINSTLDVCCDLRLKRAQHFSQIKRAFSSKQESYFSAIGGDSDAPPPDLSLAQVTSILKTNETQITDSIASVKLIQCNQLASNHPIEDRLRISKIYSEVKDDSQSSSTSTRVTNTLALACFDGHGGGACADLVARRLFNYIALALHPHPLEFVKCHDVEKIVEDLFSSPKLNTTSTLIYDDKTSAKIRKESNKWEKEYLLKYATKLKDSPQSSVSERLKDAFIQCDADLSEEIETNLSIHTSNILLHHYLSLAVSGSCATLMLIHDDRAYVASTGDCRVVMGFEDHSEKNAVKSVDLSFEHNSDNIDEIKRLFASHPLKEQNNIIRNNRLLGQLMPLRAFGDFGYKWPVEKIKKVGLTRAFGPHVIPPYYHTPPYLIVDPEVTEMPISKQQHKNIGDKFVVMATDGLWEQFESSRSVVNQVVQHRRRQINIVGRTIDSDPLEFKEGSTLKEINVVLKNRGKPEPQSLRSAAASGGLVIEDLVLDNNCATCLLRTALGSHPSGSDPHMDLQEQVQQQHKRLVTFLTLPESVVRNFRDDISIIILEFC